MNKLLCEVFVKNFKILRKRYDEGNFIFNEVLSIAVVTLEVK